MDSMGTVIGEWWDEYTLPSGERVVTPRQKNLRVNLGKILMARLMAQDLSSGTFKGVLYHAFGHGDTGWGATPPAPLVSDETLFDEYFRKVPTNVTYLTTGGAVVSGIYSNKVRFTTELGAAEANGYIREQALFGGDATGTLNSGWMINVIRHAPVEKLNGVPLTRYIELTFT